MCVRTASMLQILLLLVLRLQVKMGPLELQRVPCEIHWKLRAQRELPHVRTKRAGQSGVRERDRKRAGENRVDCFSSVLLAWHLNYLRLCQHLEFHKFWPVDACQIASGRLHTRSTQRQNGLHHVARPYRPNQHCPRILLLSSRPSAHLFVHMSCKFQIYMREFQCYSHYTSPPTLCHALRPSAFLHLQHAYVALVASRCSWNS